MQGEIQAICAEVEKVRSNLPRHKHTLTSSLASTSSSNVRCIDVTKPNPYDDTCNATVISVRDEALKVGTMPKFL